MNNSPLLIAEGFKALGHSVRLVVTRQDMLHRPESKYHELKDNYPDWILDYSRLSDDDFANETPLLDEAIRQLENGVDLVLLNDTGPSIAGRLTVPHVAYLTGSDLTYYANFDSIVARTRIWDPVFKRSQQAQTYIDVIRGFVERQRDGIRTSRLICFPHRGLSVLGDELLDSIGVQDRNRLHVHISNVDVLAPKPISQNSELTILSGCRIVYRRDCNPALADMDFKGTDILLRGFAQYCQKGGRGELRLIRKGQDVEAARTLAENLGIDSRIVWLDEMTTHDFHRAMEAADLICDQLGTALPGLVTTDAYALGRPVMGSLRNDILAEVYPEPFPGFDVGTEEDVADALLKCEADRQLLSEMGHRGREYADRYLGPRRNAERILEQIGQALPH